MECPTALKSSSMNVLLLTVGLVKRPLKVARAYEVGGDGDKLRRIVGVERVDACLKLRDA